MTPSVNHHYFFYIKPSAGFPNKVFKVIFSIVKSSWVCLKILSKKCFTNNVLSSLFSKSYKGPFLVCDVWNCTDLNINSMKRANFNFKNQLQYSLIFISWAKKWLLMNTRVQHLLFKTHWNLLKNVESVRNRTSIYVWTDGSLCHSHIKMNQYCNLN